MHFAHPLPWWLAVLVVAAVAAAAFAEYRRPVAPVSLMRRLALTTLRAAALLVLALILFRPTIVRPPVDRRDGVVPVLVDVSPSMDLADSGRSRLAAAAGVVQSAVVPAVTRRFAADVYAVSDRAVQTTADRLQQAGSHSNLTAALRDVRDRYRGRQLAGIVLVTDGGDTSLPLGSSERGDQAVPIFAIGVGSPDSVRDREVVGLSAGEQRLDQASVDLSVTVVSAGFGRTPFEIRVLANGRLTDSRRVVPVADGSPMHQVFTESPDPQNPTVYTVEIPPVEGEVTSDNNSRAVLVDPAGRKRRLLVIEGAPGFEHSFMTRAWSHDSGLEVDSVVRKGKNAEGQDTFLIQAASARSAALSNGFPSRLEDLFGYDAVVVANVEPTFFTRAQQQALADFVSERGGGLLVLGGQSLAGRGFAGTPLDAALPVDSSLPNASGTSEDGSSRNQISVTAEGELHPIMRAGTAPDAVRRMWSALPPLAAVVPVGAPRPAASVLATTTGTSGSGEPVIVVQPFGRGRSMVFAGEASWRWRMMTPSSDRSYDVFWRQAARWLATDAPDPVTIAVPVEGQIGDDVGIDVEARDAEFKPAAGAAISATVTGPEGGTPQPLALRSATAGRFSGTIHATQRGLYQIHAEARAGGKPLGNATRWTYVGGVNREFVDPRLNEGFLRRTVRASGGVYVRAADARRIAEWVDTIAPGEGAPERDDVWDRPWVLILALGLLCAEWVGRRVMGLR